MNENMVSVAELFNHYGMYLWKVQRPAAGRFVDLWSEVHASNCDDDVKRVITDVLWSVASFERACAFLEANATWIENAAAEGVPAVMAILSGPYGQQSLHYQLGLSLWMDLNDALIWYRCIPERLANLKTAARSGQTAITETEIEDELSVLRSRTVPEFNSQKIVQLSNNLLHRSWHPTIAKDTSFTLVWKGDDRGTVDFVEAGNVRDSLHQTLVEVVEQVLAFCRRVINS